MVSHVITTVAVVSLIAYLGHALPLMEGEITYQLTSTFPSPFEDVAKDTFEDVVDIINDGGEGIVTNTSSNYKAETTTLKLSELSTVVEDTINNKYDDARSDMYNIENITNKKSSSAVKDIVIRAHEDEEVFPSDDGVPQGPVLRREFDEVLVEPVGDEYVLRPADDDLETAATLVLRPYFRYSKKSRRRVGVSPRRRSARRRRPV